MLDTKLFRAFTSVAREMHFGRAAEQLHTTQSALSRSVKQLESSLGFRLFVRSTRRVALTKAGEQLLPFALKVVATTEAAVTQADFIRQGKLGCLMVGYMEFAVFGEMPRVVRRYRESNPGVEVHLKLVSSIDQSSKIIDEELDVGFMISEAAEEGVTCAPFQRDEISVILADNHPLASKDKVLPSDLRREPLVIGDRAIWRPYRIIVDNYFSSWGMQLPVAQEAHTTHAILALVAAGMGYTLHTGRLVGHLPPGLTVRRFDGDPPVVDTVLAWKRDRSLPLLDEFIKAALAGIGDAFDRSESRVDRLAQTSI